MRIYRIVTEYKDFSTEITDWFGLLSHCLFKTKNQIECMQNVGVPIGSVPQLVYNSNR